MPCRQLLILVVNGCTVKMLLVTLPIRVRMVLRSLMLVVIFYKCRNVGVIVLRCGIMVVNLMICNRPCLSKSLRCVNFVKRLVTLIMILKLVCSLMCVVRRNVLTLIRCLLFVLVNLLSKELRYEYH